MEQQLFIRIRGNVQGPFTPDKLQQLAARGQFGRLHEVSADGVAWKRASTCPELFPASAPRSTTATASTPETDAPPVTPRESSALPASDGSIHSAPASDKPAGKSAPVSAVPRWIIGLATLDYLCAALALISGSVLIFLGWQDDSPLQIYQAAAAMTYAVVMAAFASLLVVYFRARNAADRGKSSSSAAAIRARLFWVFAVVALLVVGLLTAWTFTAGSTGTNSHTSSEIIQ